MRYLNLSSLLILVVFLGCEPGSSKEEFDKTYTHNVYFWLKNPNKQEDRSAFEASITKFLNDSKYAKTNYLGTSPKAVRNVVDDSFTYHLLVTFASAEDQVKYQEEEAHLTFIEEASELWGKVIVYDSQTIN